MTVRRCLPWPDKRLRSVAEPVTEITDDSKTQIARAIRRICCDWNINLIHMLTDIPP